MASDEKKVLTKDPPNDDVRRRKEAVAERNKARKEAVAREKAAIEEKAAAEEAARKKVLVPIANGSDALEAVVVIDVLRRAYAKVVVASVEKELQINALHGVKVVADMLISDCAETVFDLIALPGGPGAKILEACKTLKDMVIKQVAENRHCVTICAAPGIAFGSWGLSKGKKATCPSVVEQVPSTTAAIESIVEKDVDVMIRHMNGTAIGYAIALVELLYGGKTATEISKELIVSPNHGEEYAFTDLNPVSWECDVSPKILVPVADGNEEMEIVIIVEVLRKAGATVVVASVGNEKQIECSRFVKLEADTLLHEVLQTPYDLIVLPDDIKGLKAFGQSEELIKLLKNQMESNKPYGAMCACPTLLEHNGLLKGKKATVYPSLRGLLIDSSEAKNRVVVDGCLATSQGIGTSLEYALVLVEKFFGREKAKEIAKAMAEPELVILRSRNQYNAMASNPDSSSGLHF